jgi:hypothetical protein
MIVKTFLVPVLAAAAVAFVRAEVSEGREPEAADSGITRLDSEDGNAKRIGDFAFTACKVLI